MKIDKDSPAFPMPNDSFGGLTKREYFAAKAMQGLLADAANESPTTDDLISIAVAAADALIAELNKENSND